MGEGVGFDGAALCWAGAGGSQGPWLVYSVSRGFPVGAGGTGGREEKSSGPSFSRRRRSGGRTSSSWPAPAEAPPGVLPAAWLLRAG